MLDFSELDAQIDSKAPEALLAGAEFLRAASVALVPVETGNLAGSGEARPSGDDEAEVYYPGPYARYQHFGLDFHHDKGQALYLSQPAMTEAESIIKIIGDGLGF